MFEKFAALRPSTAISWLALAVALGGTAVAATTTIVTIADKTGSRTAGVDVFNRLRTAAAPVAPSGSFTSLAYLGSSSAVNFLGPSKASVVVTNLDMGNYYDQVNGAGIRFAVTWVSGPNSDCSNPTFTHWIGYFMVKPGDTASITFPAGVNLKPKAPGDTWCLRVSYAVQGSPGSYYLPDFGVIGYVDSGPFATTYAAANLSVVPPRNR